MRFLATIKNNLLFRLLWWVCTLPLELLRAIIILPIATCIYVLTLTATIQLWAFLWFLIHFHILVPTGDNAGMFDGFPFMQIFLFLGFTTHFRYPLRRLNRFMLTPFWRLRRRNKYRPAKPIQASITTASVTDSAQSRSRMTNRLSPELQSMVAKRD